MNLATVLAVLLIAAVALLWVRSYRASETVQWAQEWVKHDLTVSAGTVRYHKYERHTQPFTDYYRRGFSRRTGLPTPVDRASPHGSDDTVYWNWIGFRFIASPREAAKPFGSILFFDVPCWALLVIVMPLPVARLIRARLRRRRTSQNRCPTCGYNLRATPDRCPECGTVSCLREPPHNPPMQRTEAAGIVSLVQTLPGRGFGR